MKRSAFLVVVFLVVVWPSPVLAHTEVDDTSPADGDTVEGPVDEIVVAFTEVVTVVGEGFRLLDPEGNVHQPRVESADGIVYRVLPDVPLTEGVAAVSYEVTSADGHVVEGSFHFTITAAAPVTTTTSSIDGATSETSIPAGTTTTLGSEETTPSGSGAEDESGGGTLLLVVIGTAAVVGVGGWLVARSRGRS